MRKMRAADLFCGAGGTTTGAEESGAVGVIFALNHWDIAIQTHSRNYPHARHVNSRLEMTSPSECDRIDVLFASPECTHHSKARGGRPTSDQQRSGAWHVLPWIEHHRPSYVVIENVTEFQDWGPVGKDGRPLESMKGRFFDAWLMAVKSAGYCVEYRELNAADYGAATSRKRLFLIARKGRRSPPWPDATHSRCEETKLLPWRSAAEVIDWNIPCPSIFARTRPLAEKTLSRFDAGCRRFVGPFVVKFKGEQTGESIDNPLTTITAGGKAHGLAIPFSMQFDNHGGNGSYVRGLRLPFGTFTTKQNMGLAIPFLADVNHGESGGTRTYSVGDSLGTISTKNGKAIVIPWLSHFYGTNNMSPVGDPVDTITTKDRHSLCMAVCRGPEDWPPATSEAMQRLQFTMRELGISDLLFRMFSNPELAAAQGFPGNYYFAGTRADITRQIGNSVSPPIAKAISTAIAG